MHVVEKDHELPVAGPIGHRFEDPLIRLGADARIDVVWQERQHRTKRNSR